MISIKGKNAWNLYTKCFFHSTLFYLFKIFHLQQIPSFTVTRSNKNLARACEVINSEWLT